MLVAGRSCNITAGEVVESVYHSSMPHTPAACLLAVMLCLQVMMQLDSQGLQAQEAAETARREAGKLGMKVLQQQMQVRRATQAAASMVLSAPCTNLSDHGTLCMCMGLENTSHPPQQHASWKN